MDDFERVAGVGIGYTLATGRMFCDVSEFHSWAEKLLGRPIFTHEFGDHETWDELRSTFEEAQIALLTPEGV